LRGLLFGVGGRVKPVQRIAMYQSNALGMIRIKEEKNVYRTDCYFNPYSRWRTADLATLQEMGVLSQRWSRIDSCDFDHSAGAGTDLISVNGRSHGKPEQKAVILKMPAPFRKKTGRKHSGSSTSGMPPV
jgi:hypothetical protein